MPPTEIKCLKLSFHCIKKFNLDESLKMKCLMLANKT